VPGTWRAIRFGGLALLCAALVVTVAAPPADAARKKKKGEASKHVLKNKKDGKKLTEVHEFLQNDQWDEARKVLDSYNLEKTLDRDPYAYTLVNQAYGFIEANAENYPKAAEHFAAALTTNTLPPSQQLSTRFNLGQIYMMLDDWDNAVATLEIWFEEADKPQPIAYYMLALAHYQNGDQDAALEPARNSVELASNPKENWMQLLLSIYMERRAYEQARPLLARMVLRFDKATYYTRLAAVLSELEQDEDALAVQQLAYARGFLDSDRALIRLAQTFAFNNMPWQGALVMERALEEEAVPSDMKSWRLYANSLLAARETQKALPALETAAGLSDDGEVFVQLSQVYIQSERWTDALDALAQAFEKGDLQNPGHAHLLVGIAAYQIKRLGQARSAFAKAKGHEKSRDMAERWLQFVAREQAAQAS
jgi:tetratricopeptide (TPR) repeat protein